MQNWLIVKNETSRFNPAKVKVFFSQIQYSMINRT